MTSTSGGEFGAGTLVPLPYTINGNGLLGYRSYRVIEADPENSVKGIRVFAKDPLGAAAQVYHVYSSQHKRPRRKIRILFERGKKHISIIRKGDMLMLKYDKK